MRRIAAAVALCGAIAIGPGSAASEEPRIVFARIVSNEQYAGRNPAREHVADLFSFRPDGRGLRRLTATVAWEDDPAWSPNGRRLAFTRGAPVCHGLTCEGSTGSSVWVAHTNGAAPRRLTRPPEGYLDRGPAWSPDGRRIAFVRHYGTDEAVEDGIYVIDASGRGLRRLQAGRTETCRISWSPDGRTIAAGLALLNVATGEVRVLHAAGVPREPRAVAWSPTGRLLAVAAEDGVHVVPIDGGRSRHIVTARFVDGLAWSPDGKRLAFGGRRTPWTPRLGARGSPPTDLFVVSADGSSLRRLTSSPGAEFSPGWTS